MRRTSSGRLLNTGGFHHLSGTPRFLYGSGFKTLKPSTVRELGFLHIENIEMKAGVFSGMPEDSRRD